MNKKTDRVETMLAAALISGLVTGFAGLIGALFCVFGGRWEGAGICLVASALAFGLIANALLRD